MYDAIGLEDPCLEGGPPQAQNYLLACYLVSLVKGESIKGKMLRKKTIDRYLSAALAIFDKRDIKKPRKTAEVDLVKLILDAIKRYEQVKKRRSMISDSMMVDIIKTAADADPNGLDAALADWIILGQYTGFRLSEWGQEKTNEYARIAHTNDAVAMIAADFVFKGPNRIHLDGDNLPLFECIEAVEVFWRHQKNGDHGQSILYTRNRRKPQICGVAAAYRIRTRAQRLGNPMHYPLGIHYSGSGNKFITGDDTARFLRSVAARVFHLNPRKQTHKDILELYSSHSIRVRAANVLYREGKSDSYIQTRLRWQSRTFLNYLRNTIHAAMQHNETMDIPADNLPDLMDNDDDALYHDIAEQNLLVSWRQQDNAT